MEEDGPIPDEAPPLAVDIDGTLTDAERALDPRVIPVLRGWPAPVAIATGKAFPYPVGLCEFLGLDQTVIAENGGVVLAGQEGPLRYGGDVDGAQAVVAEFESRGHDLGWGEVDLVNRWRETEVAVSREAPKDVLEEIAGRHNLVVLDTGFAYHITAPDVDKGRGLTLLASELELRPSDFVAVGDSENDAPLFDVVDRAVAVANADERAAAAADYVTSATFADGFLEAAAWLTGGTA